jgi:hypothetical protein
MAIFQAFFDESGKFEDKSVTSFCGLCSPENRVREFEEDWKGLLRNFGLQCLTMKRALRRKIPFSSNTPAKSAEERNNVLQSFAQCIRKHFELGVAITVDVDAYKKWSPQARKRVGGSDDPHYFAFLCAVTASAKYLTKDEDRFSLICDDDQKTAVNCYRLYSRVKTVHAELRRKMVSITFADDNEFAPLQAADLLASLCRLESARRFHRDYYDYAPSFQALTGPGSGMYWGVSFYDTERINDLGDKLLRHK